MEPTKIMPNVMRRYGPDVLFAFGSGELGRAIRDGVAPFRLTRGFDGGAEAGLDADLRGGFDGGAEVGLDADLRGG